MLQMGEAIVRRMETLRRPGSFHPGLSMIFSENRSPLFGIMLLELLDRLRPDDDHVLAEAALELRPVGAPPAAVERVGHDLEDDDLVMADLAVLGPQALGRGAGECGEPAEALGELRPHEPVRFRREVVAVVVVERQEELDEVHGRERTGAPRGFAACARSSVLPASPLCFRHRSRRLPKCRSRRGSPRRRPRTAMSRYRPCDRTESRTNALPWMAPPRPAQPPNRKARTAPPASSGWRSPAPAPSRRRQSRTAPAAPGTRSASSGSRPGLRSRRRRSSPALSRRR